jgi:hypothetical protein
MKTPTKHFQVRHDTGVYEYRGYMLWKDAARNGWSIGEQSLGPFSTLKEAKKHVDRLLKYPSLRFKKLSKQCPKNPQSDTSNSPPQK